MKLTIATIVYRNSSYPYLDKFLTSLKKASAFLSSQACQIYIADNSGKDDKNRNALKNRNYLGDKKIRYLDFGENLGFAKAYNILIKTAKAEGSKYFLMLNPDILIEEKAIETLLSYFEKNQNLAALTGKILVWDFKNNLLKNIIDSCGIVLKSPLNFKDLGQNEPDEGIYDHSSIIGPSGAVAMFNLELLETIKENGQYFDENFFMYKEDCDLAYRLYINNLQTKLVPKALFYHDRSVSGGSLKERIKNRRKRSKKERSWSFFGQHYLFIKHWSKQSFSGKFSIIIQIIKLFIYSLIFERFVLKEYKNIFKLTRK
jgi:GT2 family glycosyltransferase